MAKVDTALKLVELFETNRDRYFLVLKKSIKAYFKLIEEIANDIYNSCIEDYYAKYTPKVYTRHGNKKGFNLYEANDISTEEVDEGNISLSLDFDPDNLLLYGGKNGEEKRYEVLSAVMNGIRGTKKRTTKTGEKWPQSWATSYPNNFSRMQVWGSDGSTMDAIFEDFASNVLTDLDSILWDFIEEYI